MRKWLLLIIITMLLCPLVMGQTTERFMPYKSLFASNGSTTSAIGDYSSADMVFQIQPPQNETWFVYRMMLEVRDVGSLDANKYGNNIDLTNGIWIEHVQNSVGYNLTDSNVFTNADWGAYMYDISVSDYGTDVTEYLNGRWTFAKSGTVLKLNGTNNDSIKIHLNDDFSGLTNHRFLFQGYKLNATQYLDVAEDDNMEGTPIAITIFILFAASLFIIASFAMKKFTEHQITNMIIKRALLIVGIFLMVLNSAVVASLGSALSINVTQELYRYMWFFGWVGYLLLITLVVKTLFDIVKMYKKKKLSERMGDSE